MSNITKEEIIERMNETEKVLLEKLHLKENLSNADLQNFYVRFIPYLMHNRNKDNMLGRRPETLKENVDKYIDFCVKVGLNELEIIKSIENFPSILHTFDDEFIDKYVIMGVAENDTNTLRKEKLIHNPRAFAIDINTIYARYMFMKSLNYDINWSNLVKATNNEFAKIFVISEYYKPYKIYKSVDDVNKVLKNYYSKIDYNVINELRKMNINSNLFNGATYGKK